MTDALIVCAVRAIGCMALKQPSGSWKIVGPDGKKAIAHNHHAILMCAHALAEEHYAREGVTP